jgi:alpha-beta hydrolase superfamily lysophospholipase
MKRAAQIVLSLLVVLPLLAAGAGTLLASGMLHPMKRALTPELVKVADDALSRVNAKREDFEVRAPDGVILRGWKVRPPNPNPSTAPGTGGDWVLLFHGVSDNRVGVTGHAEFLLRNGFSVLMMDVRAHGESGGDKATYGWLERHDTQAIAEALFSGEKVHCFFLLGESMGASIALQSAAVEPRVDGVVAESAFANLKEVSFDYAGLHVSHWLGRTLFRPASSLALKGATQEGGFKAEDVSPEKAVAERPFPVLLICGTGDHNVPARHTKRIYEAAVGPKEMWLVKGADHAAALGKAPEEFERRVLNFYRGIHARTQN